MLSIKLKKHGKNIAYKKSSVYLPPRHRKNLTEINLTNMEAPDSKPYVIGLDLGGTNSVFGSGTTSSSWRSSQLHPHGEAHNFILMEKLTHGKEATRAAKAAIRLLLPYMGDGVKTITTDNGSECGAHEAITKALGVKTITTDNGSECGAHEAITKALNGSELCAHYTITKALGGETVYFADSYCSWQKGAIVAERCNRERQQTHQAIQPRRLLLLMAERCNRERQQTHRAIHQAIHPRRLLLLMAERCNRERQQTHRAIQPKRHGLR